MNKIQEETQNIMEEINMKISGSENALKTKASRIEDIDMPIIMKHYDERVQEQLRKNKD